MEEEGGDDVAAAAAARPKKDGRHGQSEATASVALVVVVDVFIWECGSTAFPLQPAIVPSTRNEGLLLLPPYRRRQAGRQTDRSAGIRQSNSC